MRDEDMTQPVTPASAEAPNLLGEVGSEAAVGVEAYQRGVHRLARPIQGLGDRRSHLFYRPGDSFGSNHPCSVDQHEEGRRVDTVVLPRLLGHDHWRAPGPI